MPHSSGGGSRSGGHHSSHGHSSHGSSRKSVSSHIHKHYRKGYRSYAYYNRRTRDIEYLYSDIDLKSRKGGSKSELIAWLILWSIVLGIFSVIGIMAMPQFKPGRLRTSSDYKIEVIDEVGIESGISEDELRGTLQEFKTITGITPCVLISSRMSLGNRIVEDYAYSEYVKRYKDEDHWLIVYIEDDEWEWEGMQGDNTDIILTRSITNKFNKDMQKSLMNTNDAYYSINHAFKSIQGSLMGFRITLDHMVLFIFLFIGLIPLIASINAIRKQNKEGTAYKYRDLMDLGKREDKGNLNICRCSSCNGKYIRAINSECPYCGNTTIL